MISCLYPDCDFSSDVEEPTKGGRAERDKRLVIAHINTEHADAQVLIACKCDFELVEEIDELRKGPEGTFRDHTNVMRCVRCGDKTRETVTEAVPPEPEAADEYAVIPDAAPEEHHG